MHGGWRDRRQRVHGQHEGRGGKRQGYKHGFTEAYKLHYDFGSYEGGYYYGKKEGYKYGFDAAYDLYYDYGSYGTGYEAGYEAGKALFNEAQ